MEQEAKITSRLHTTQKGKIILPKKVGSRKESLRRKGRLNNAWDRTCWYFLQIWLCSRPGVIYSQKCLQYSWQHAMFILFLTPQQPGISRPRQKQICSFGSKRKLGLSTKFIPTKPFTSSATELEKSQDNFRRDVQSWNCFFADT